MNYEAVLLDPMRGHHRRGVGCTPLAATTDAFQKILRFEFPDHRQDEVYRLNDSYTAHCMLTVSVKDEYYEDVRPLKDTINEMLILVRKDVSKQCMYTPCGWVRPIP